MKWNFKNMYIVYCLVLGFFVVFFTETDQVSVLQVSYLVPTLNFVTIHYLLVEIGNLFIKN